MAGVFRRGMALAAGAAAALWLAIVPPSVAWASNWIRKTGDNAAIRFDLCDLNAGFHTAWHDNNGHDIDPTDTNQVLWALCTRTEVAEDIDVVRKCWSTPLDPMAYAGEEQRYYNNRLIIDACRPYDRRHSFPAVARVSAEEAQALRARRPLA